MRARRVRPFLTRGDKEIYYANLTVYAVLNTIAAEIHFERGGKIVVFIQSNLGLPCTQGHSFFFLALLRGRARRYGRRALRVAHHGADTQDDRLEVWDSDTRRVRRPRRADGRPGHRGRRRSGAQGSAYGRLLVRRGGLRRQRVGRAGRRFRIGDSGRGVWQGGLEGDAGGYNRDARADRHRRHGRGKAHRPARERDDDVARPRDNARDGAPAGADGRARLRDKWA